jgi:hypothetical protein
MSVCSGRSAWCVAGGWLRGRGITVVSTLCSLLLATTAGATYVEDFESGWANNGSGNLGTGASLNGWAIRDAGVYHVTNVAPHGIVIEYSVFASGVSVWHTGGKAHGESLAGVTALEFSVDVAIGQRFDTGLIWLSDATQNGYGIVVGQAFDGGPVSFSIRKMRGHTGSYGVNPTVSWTDGQWGTNMSGDVAAATGDYDDWVTLNLRLEQAGAGQPVTLKLYHSGSNNDDTTAASPDATHVDDGVAAGAVFDLTDLTHVGLTLQNAPAQPSGPTYIRIDNITVAEGDTTDPVLTCPADYTGTIDGDPPNTNDTGAATATDDTDPSPAVTYVDVVGEDGVITRTWTATDISGNSTSCDQILSDLTYLEDFEVRWANGTSDSNVSGDLDLGDDGASMNGWKSRSAAYFSIQDRGAPWNNGLQFNGGAFNESGWTCGREHGLPMLGAISLQLSGAIREAPAASVTDTAWLWLSDANANGYGVRVVRTGPGNNQAAIFKGYGSTALLGGGGSGNPSVNWTVGNGYLPVAAVNVGTAYGDFITFYVRLEQATSGGDVTVTLWHTGSNTADTSPGSPDMTWTDDGTTGGILNLTNLTWVGLTADNSPSASPIQFDDLGVSVGYPPPQGTLITIQ